VTKRISRKLITGQRMMIAQSFLDEESGVPIHSHQNEQVTYVLEGALPFCLGEEETVVVRAGEILPILSNVHHRAEALEDTLDVDIFCPPRQDTQLAQPACAPRGRTWLLGLRLGADRRRPQRLPLLDPGGKELEPLGGPFRRRGRPGAPAHADQVPGLGHCGHQRVMAGLGYPAIS